jgi:hypothetical protein
MYIYRTDGLLVEENLFDRNGWNNAVPGSTPSVFLHNVYINSGNTSVVFRGNIVAGTDGVLARSGGTVEDNVFLRNAIALEFGGGEEPDLQGDTGFVRNNVVLDGGDIITSTLPRGWALRIRNIVSATVENNIISNNTNGHGPRVFSLEAANGWSGNTRGVENTVFQNNIVYNWGGSIEFNGSLAQTVNVQLHNNKIQNWADAYPLVSHYDGTSTSGVISADNQFYSSGLPESVWMRENGANESLTTWKAHVGDTTSSGTQDTFPNPNRTIATYHASIGGAPTLEAFLAEARMQSKANWRSQYTAAAVRNYIRAGFGL